MTDDRGNSDEEVREDYITVLPGWNAGSVAGSAWDGLVTLGQTLANVLIWIGIFSPVWIIVGLVALWAWRRSKKRAGQ